MVDTSAIYVPVDFDDALVRLDSLLGAEQIEQFRSMDSEEAFLGSTHHGLGTWLRNNWGLWAGSRLASYFNGVGVYHPDDMSGIILTSYYRRLHDQPLQFQEQVAHYQAYWEKARQREEAEQAETLATLLRELDEQEEKMGLKVVGLSESYPMPSGVSDTDSTTVYVDVGISPGCDQGYPGYPEEISLAQAAERLPRPDQVLLAKALEIAAGLTFEALPDAEEVECGYYLVPVRFTTGEQ